MGDEEIKNVTMDVHLTIPSQYYEFWQELCRIYGLPENAIDQVASMQLIRHLNLIHDEIASQPILSAPKIKKSLDLKILGIKV